MKTIAVLVALLHISILSAQTPPPPESRQLDFWLGDWEVFSPDGKKQGENRIERMTDGWGLLENWTAANGTTGKSLNTWTRARSAGNSSGSPPVARSNSPAA